MATTYNLTCKNESRSDGTFCVYQTMPDQNDDIYSLAWFAKQAHYRTTVIFDWDIQHCVSWGETGELRPGVRYTASQINDADPSNTSKNSFDFLKRNNAYTFQNSSVATSKGTIGIHCRDNIPNRDASIGLGMNGKTAFATQALMNFNFIFMPKVRYWLAFGRYEVGEVMDLHRSTNAVEIRYSPNVYEITATLGEDYRWTLR